MSLQAQGRATPLDEQVPTTDTAIWFIKAFELLTRERSTGMSIGPIPPSAMYNYADRFDLIGSLEEFIEVICAMDDAYTKYVAGERQKQQKREQQRSTFTKR